MKQNFTINYFKNGSMSCSVVAYYMRSTDYNDNIAIVFIGGKAQPFTLVNGLQIEDNKGSWAFAYRYDIATLKEAQELFLSKIK